MKPFVNSNSNLLFVNILTVYKNSLNLTPRARLATRRRVQKRGGAFLFPKFSLVYMKNLPSTSFIKVLWRGDTARCHKKHFFTGDEEIIRKSYFTENADEKEKLRRRKFSLKISSIRSTFALPSFKRIKNIKVLTCR